MRMHNHMYEHMYMRMSMHVCMHIESLDRCVCVCVCTCVCMVTGAQQVNVQPRHWNRLCIHLIGSGVQAVQRHTLPLQLPMISIIRPSFAGTSNQMEGSWRVLDSFQALRISR